MFCNKITVVAIHVFSSLWFPFVTGNDNVTTTPKPMISVASHPKAQMVNVSIAECTNLPFEVHGDVSSINTRNLCARFWDGWNCTGMSIEIMARSPSHGDLTPWGFNDRTLSVGPCRNSCDLEVTGKMPDAPFDITIYRNKNFRVLPESPFPINVTVSGCTLIPEEFQESNLGSVKTYGHCVQLWSNPHCILRENSTDDTVELRWGTPYHGNLYDGWWMRKATAVSHCRHKCNDTEEVTSNKASKLDGTDEKSKGNSSTSTGWVWFLLVFMVLGFAGVGYFVFQRFGYGGRMIAIPRRRLDADF